MEKYNEKHGVIQPFKWCDLYLSFFLAYKLIRLGPREIEPPGDRILMKVIYWEDAFRKDVKGNRGRKS